MGGGVVGQNVCNPCQTLHRPTSDTTQQNSIKANKFYSLVFTLLPYDQDRNGEDEFSYHVPLQKRRRLLLLKNNNNKRLLLQQHNYYYHHVLFLSTIMIIGSFYSRLHRLGFYSHLLCFPPLLNGQHSDRMVPHTLVSFDSQAF